MSEGKPELRWVVCGTRMPPHIDLGRSNSISNYGTIDEAVAAVKLELEAGKHVLVQRYESPR